MRRILILVVLMICVIQVFAQTRTITGTVTSKDDGLTIPGVNVSIKGTTIGTTTDMKGNYSLQVEPQSILLFSFVGYQTMEILVGDQLQINMILESETKSLEEVVVIGYGTQKKSHLTGSISKFKNENLDETSVTRLDQALQGKIAGVQIQNTTSEAGVEPKVRVRGMGSISANSAPLVVVDGHPVDDGLSFVNMADVESVEVLKDAASAAIYGSRGANGVIIITTKSGKADKPKYNFKSSYGVRSAYELWPLMTFSDYVRLLYKEADLRATDPTVAAGSINVTSDNEKAAYVLENTIQNGKSTDWQLEGIRKIALLKNYQMSVSGGKKDLIYYISGNYQDEQGQMYHSNYTKMGLRAKLSGQLSKSVKFNVNLNPSYAKTERPSVNYTDFIRFPSWLPVYHTDATVAYVHQNPQWATLSAGDWAQATHFTNLPYSGELPDGTIWSTGSSSPSTSANNTPKSIMERNMRNEQNYRMLNSADLTINLIKGLDFKSSGSVYFAYTENTDLTMKNAKKDGDPNIRIFTGNMSIDLLSENILTYKRSLGKHDINTMLGFTAQKRRNNFRGIYGSSFPSDNILTLNNGTQYDVNGTYTRSESTGLLSYLGRLNYSYNDKYLVSVSIRADGSSMFAKGNQWGYFPSTSLGWQVSKESFMKSISWISSLKLRTSYGATGNNRIQNYAYTDLLYGQGTAVGVGTGQMYLGLAPTDNASANKKITWERTFEYNLGFDLGLFKDRINLTAEYYNSKTDHLLFQQSAMSFTGYNQYWNNIGKVQNKGLEFELTTVNISSKDFSWKSSFNISSNQNELLELGGEPFQYSYGERNEIYAAIVGQPSIQFFGYKTNGIWLSQADVDAAVAAEIAAGNGTTNISKYFAAGGLKTVDVNGDGKITTDDRVVIGSPFPKFTWGFSNTLKYKGFDLSILFQGVQGNEVINGDAYYNETRKINAEFTANRWISAANPGDGKTPYFTNGQDWMLTDYVVEDGSYMALREVLLGYELPTKLSKIAHLSSLRVYISGENLLYFMAKGFRGINPEGRYTSGAYSSPMVDGYTRGSYPVGRTISLGLEINF